MTITKTNVCKFGRNQEGVLLESGVIALKFIGKTYTDRHIKRVNKCLEAIKKGIINKAKYMDSLKPCT